jgi:hypothetical protein
MNDQLSFYDEKIQLLAEDPLVGNFSRRIAERVTGLISSNVHLRYSYFRDVCNPKDEIQARKVVDAVLLLTNPYVKILDMKYEALNFQGDYEPIDAFLVSEMYVDKNYYNPITGLELEPLDFSDQVRMYFFPTQDFVERMCL